MSGKASYKDGLGFEVGIFLLLIGLAALSVVSSFTNLGIWNIVIVLSIAFIQTALVFLFFMHLNESSGFIKLLIFGSFLWVGVMFGMTFNDFLSRQYVTPQKDTNTWITRAPHQYTETPAHSEHHA